MSINIREMISKINLLDGCDLFPHSGMPVILHSNHQLPADLREFYSLCGGVVLFAGADYEITIVPPEQFVPANPVIIGEQVEDDITADWYIIGDVGNSSYITIDLASERLGKCYDSFFETHGLVGDCAVVAESFTELLLHLIVNQGDYFYWLKDEFISLGDAYD